MDKEDKELLQTIINIVTTLYGDKIEASGFMSYLKNEFPNLLFTLDIESKQIYVL